MFTELVQHLRPHNIDLIDLAIVELIAGGTSELRELSESLGKGRSNIQYAYARVESLERKGWLSEPKQKPNCKRFKIRRITPEGRKRMKKVRAMVQECFCVPVIGNEKSS